MNKGLHHHILLAFCVLVFSGFSCTDIYNVDDVRFEGGDAEYAIPLVNSSLTLEDLFNEDETETELIVYPDKSLSLFYSGDVLQQTAEDIFGRLPGGLPIVIQSKNDTISLPFQRLILIKADLTGDSLYFLTTNIEDFPLDVVITVPSLLRSGSPLIINQRVGAAIGGVGTQVVSRLSMNGLSMQLTDNDLIVQYEATDDMGQTYEIDQMLLLYNSMTIGYAEGFFTKNTLNIPGDFIDIDIYDQWITGELYFDDPKVTVSVDNSFGFPVRADIKQLRFVGNKGQIVDLDSPQNDSINFDYPGLNEVGVVKTNKVFYDVNNSNIDQIINIQPRRLEYDIDAVANPDQDSTIIGFFTDSSYIRINVSVELPVSGWANGFEARDTIDFDLDDIDGASEAEFKIDIKNGMPISTTVQMVFLDNQNAVLDSLFISEPLLIESADVDGSGISINPSSLIHFETIDRAKIERLNRATRAVLDVSFLTKDAPNQIVKVRSCDAFDVKMGVKFKVQ